MITPELAQALRAADLPWRPEPGDRFTIPGGELDQTVFVISDMTIEVETAAGGGLVKFNGTTEWALDSIESDQVLWLPREDQLRTALGGSFVALTRRYDSWLVTVRADDQETSFIDNDVECAYAKAWLGSR